MGSVAMTAETGLPITAPPSGSLYLSGSNTTASAGVINQGRYHPLWVGPFNIASILIETTIAGGVGSVSRLGLYDAHPTTSRPNRLLVDAGVVGSEVIGVIEVPLVAPYQWRGGLMYGIVVPQVGSTPTYRASINMFPLGFIPVQPNPANLAANGFISGTTISGALPQQADVVTFGGTGMTVGLRAA